MTLTVIRQKMLYSSAMGCFWFVCVNDLVKVVFLKRGKRGAERFSYLHGYFFVLEFKEKKDFSNV